MNRLSVLVSFAALSGSVLSNYGSTGKNPRPAVSLTHIHYFIANSARLAQPQLGPGVNPVVVNLGIPSSIANVNLGDISFEYENDNGMPVAGNLT